MTELESKLNAATDFLGVASLGGVILSGILLFTPVKAMGYIGIGSGLGAFTASIVTRKKHLRVADQYANKLSKHYDNELTTQDNEIVSLTSQIINLGEKLKLAQTKEETAMTAARTEMLWLIIKELMVVLAKQDFRFNDLLEALAEYSERRADWSKVTEHLVAAANAVVEAKEQLTGKSKK